MIDMVYYKDAQIVTFYNLIKAHPVSEDTLCNNPIDLGYFEENRIFGKY